LTPRADPHVSHFSCAFPRRGSPSTTCHQSGSVRISAPTTSRGRPGWLSAPPHPQGRRAAAARVSGERRVWGRTGRVEGPPTPPVAFAPPATPRRTRRREGAPRAAAWAAPTGRTARVGRTDREGRTYREGRAPPARAPPDRRARPPPASAPPHRMSVAGRERRGRDGLDAAPTPAAHPRAAHRAPPAEVSACVPTSIARWAKNLPQACRIPRRWGE